MEEMNQETQVLIEKNVPCEMRDGTILRANVYRPNREGTFPVLLTRLPYNKDLPRYSQGLLDPIEAASHGFVVIIQDVRGRFHSEGEFKSYTVEETDGYDTVEWAAALPYSNGKVGMYGISYYGYTQLLAAIQRPPHLVAIFPAMTFNDLRNGVVYRGGAYEIAARESWTLGLMVPDFLLRKHGKTREFHAAIQKYAEHVNHLEDGYWHVPIKEWPPLRELEVAESFYQQLDRPPEDPAWTHLNISHRYDELQVPAYHLAGWYDCFLQPTLQNYMEMATRDEQRLGKSRQKLIIGPWAHGVFTSLIGERSFGIQASGDSINLVGNLTSLQLRWFSHWLENQDNQIMEEPPVKLFVMGINQWRDEQEWPLARTIYTPYFLHSDGNANSLHGGGLLQLSEPEDEKPDTFVYDPHNPVPTRGGATLIPGVLTMGPRDQREIEEREDVLVYTSEPLEEPLEVTGPVKVKFWASSDAEDTDFVARIIDVLPDGSAYNLTDGIIRARYRHGFTPEPIKKEEIVEYEIDLWSTSNVFLSGHRIRLEITSSNFPRYDRNPNTGKTTIESADMKPATQTVFHNWTYPSQLVLPIIPN